MPPLKNLIALAIARIAKSTRLLMELTMQAHLVTRGIAAILNQEVLSRLPMKKLTQRL